MILDAIVAAKRRAHAGRDAAADRRARDRASAAPPVRSLARRIAATAGPRIIAEFKRRSPSAGIFREALAPPADAAAIARDYAAAGALALSILTDGEFFGGSLADLAAARAAVALPLLRKDFVLYPEDLVDARAAGADVVLLIVRLLDDARLAALLAAALALGLEALVEVHSDDECRRALDAGAQLIGVNHRDLDSLVIDLDLSARLVPQLSSVVRVAESGLKNAADVRRAFALGYHAVLVGEAFLSAASPGAALAAMVSACG